MVGKRLQDSVDPIKEKRADKNVQDLNSTLNHRLFQQLYVKTPGIFPIEKMQLIQISIFGQKLEVSITLST